MQSTMNIRTLLPVREANRTRRTGHALRVGGLRRIRKSGVLAGEGVPPERRLLRTSTGGGQRLPNAA